MDDRVKPFEGVRNFRDFGGYEGADGARIKTGKLYRSGHFGEATDQDLTGIELLNIKVQADLRRPDERERHGDKWPVSGVQKLFSDHGRETEAPHVNFLKQVAVDAEASKGWMRNYYVEAPYRQSLVPTYTAWFEMLETLPTEDAALVNCAAGKDRTGILCALTHHVLGVSMDDIFVDYELTNTAARAEERLPEARDYFNSMLGKSYDGEIYKPFLGVEREFLEAAIASIEEKSGSLDTYLEEALAVGPSRRHAIRENLLD
ncbi:tyrosine-protein phosphatase [Henriciella pelagia]|jgi:protein tyrosine/serine phosphatase|uniref:Protein-tyrosine-phosphatase n=1 Tax=Henriciella pelagia TaxID=1977912 RepID=A0ABQ1JJA3_9PROT|nr:tyrosine-protein phosphatase [Henriciella pelagia]GGB70432.1 protein-tyrosine-phosphatase [Henriciella pelagia]